MELPIILIILICFIFLNVFLDKRYAELDKKLDELEYRVDTLIMSKKNRTPDNTKVGQWKKN